jgi:hypothetical protein
MHVRRGIRDVSMYDLSIKMLMIITKVRAVTIFRGKEIGRIIG